MLTNENLEARKPAADAPEREHYGYRIITEFVYFMRETGLNVPDVAKMFDISYAKLRTCLYGKPGTRVLVQADLSRIHRVQESKDYPHARKINLFYLVTGDREAPDTRTWKAMAESRGRMLEEAQRKLDALETIQQYIRRPN